MAEALERDFTARCALAELAEKGPIAIQYMWCSKLEREIIRQRLITRLNNENTFAWSWHVSDSVEAVTAIMGIKQTKKDEPEGSPLFLS
jgi:hypothetical protein